MDRSVPVNRKPLHSKRSPLARLVGAAALGLTLSATSAFAAPVRIDIPAQPLASALTNLGSQAHLQIIFNQAQVQNLRSPGVHGEMEPARALEQLLRGTGIRYQVDGSRVTLLGADAAGNDTLAMPAQVVTAAPEGTDSYVPRTSTSASKTDTPLLEIPQSVSVITRKQMDAQGVQNVSQALRYVPGVRVETYGQDPKGYDWLFIRGFNGQTTSDYLDGLRQLNNSYTFFRTEPYALERIDVVRGPSSTLFGLGDAGGIINRVSKLPTAAGVHEVELGFGNHDRIQGRFDIGDRLVDDGSLLYRVVGVVRKSNTEFEYDDGHEVKDDRYYIAPSFTWAPDEDTSFTFLSSFMKDDSGGTIAVNTPQYGHTDNTLLGDHSFNHSYQDQFTLGYQFRHRFNDNVEFRQNLRYGQVDFILNNMLPLGTVQSAVPALAALVPSLANDVLRSPRRWDEHMNAFTVDNQLQFDFDTAGIQHTLLTGIDYSRTESDVKRYFESLSLANLSYFLPLLLDPSNPKYGLNINRPSTIQVNYDQDIDAVGYYAQDQIRFDDNWLLTLGGRYDNVRSSTDDHIAGSHTLAKDDAFTGRVGLTYLTDFGLAPYVAYSESFVPNSGIDGNGNTFDPSTAHQWETGVKYQPTDKFLLTLAGFEIEKTNVLTNEVLNGVSTGFQKTTGKVRSRGIEAEVKAQLDEHWDLLGSYTYTKTKILKSNNGDEGNRFANVPEHMASAWLNYTFREGVANGLSVGGGVRYTGSVYGDNGNTFHVDNYTLYDAGVSYPVNKNVTLSFAAQNLLDEKYVTTCDDIAECYPGEGRTVLTSVKYAW
ncbi:TonB-dependent siderophore receptor [Pseudomonas citronellolis]|uniref:TonB-dependent siderophore receptor n=1 Tax=Pseudomonas TaxID=286 RepID=UPI00068B5975|nr:TonB-dependent receptor [Pseudomonas sp. PI1]